MKRNSKMIWYIVMVFGGVLIIFGLFSLVSSINLQLEQKREKEALIGLFYNQSNSEDEANINTPVDDESSIVIEGDTIGVIRIPKIELVAPIGFGVTDEVLKKQVGMYTTTDKFLTIGGNTGLAAHTSFKNGCSYCYFYHLRDVEIDDYVYIDYKDKETYIFRVIDILNDEAIEADVAYKYKKEGSALITLSTCSDYGNKRDFVVAEFIKTE